MGKHLKKPVSLRLDDEELALLERMASKHGGKQRAIVQGLKTLEGSNTLTDAELISMLKQRLDGKNAQNPDLPPNPVKENLHERKIIMPPKR